ncbi:alpha,alpha-trehalose-phosphate synthase (UDP-forming) [Amycolatopsis magusensis]|uniref:alpha,alpha-trehalose-phosphate synthase (UDP-forming) n=1 Tax=Amycolatopsis magusensis TaxID=882444 RepID=UPI0024A8124B|nr:trehalose-6-phosphate synthase [Amycolatopsis magusensis]MDI5978222.1 trehalose-6-phosphate synthase [Amycolatopsis magusensis]
MSLRPGTAELVIASNRGPVELRKGYGGLVAHRGGGGLISVLGSALARRDGVWVAAAITGEDRCAARDRDGGHLVVELPGGRARVRVLPVDPADYDGYYRGISNELLWFLQHQLFDRTREPVVDARLRSDWSAYRRVNELFAETCAGEVADGGSVLLQDYHLSLAPRALRLTRPDVRIAHYTMIPWTDPADFSVLPADMAAEFLDGLLGADMLAFLVPRWADAFMATCARAGYRTDPAARAVVDRDGREVAIRCFPVGVDAARLRATARQRAVVEHRDELERLTGGRRLIVRVDRMEPSKNILRGLAAYAELLARDTSLHDHVTHYVLAYASRGELAAYQDYDRDVRALVTTINDRFGTPSWRPVVLETGNDFTRGLAAMALAEVLVVNAVRDGMNLVAKEGPVISERQLVLVLSTQAGAADALADAAIMVHPFDVTALADGIAAGLAMPPGERAERLARLRTGAAACPPEQWLSRSLDELARLRSAPVGISSATGIAR